MASSKPSLRDNDSKGLADRPVRILIAFAKAHSPFYADRLRSVDVPSLTEADFQLLPVTMREDIAAYLPEMVTSQRVREALRGAKPMSRDVILTQSGGSSGEPLSVVVESSTIRAEADILSRAIEAWNAQRRAWHGAPILTVLTTSAPEYRRQHLWPHVRPRRRHAIPVDLPFDRLVTRLNRIRTDVLFVYASMVRPLLTLTESCQLRATPRLVIAAAERLPPRDREDVARIWGAGLIDGWGTSETGPIALTTGLDDGPMHVLNDVIVETSTDNEVLVTPLRRSLLPLIRYALHDRVTMRGDCILDVRPRTECTFVYASGIVVTTDALRAPFETATGVLEYGIHQTRDGVELAIVRLPRTDVESIRVAVRDVLLSHGVEPGRVTIRFVDRVARTTHAGKLVRFSHLSEWAS